MANAAHSGTRPNSPGALISFEGLDGVGKTTQISLLEQALDKAGYETLRVREPGATALGEAVRTILLDKQGLDIAPTAELLLFEAARAQLVERVILPALARGRVVVCDRFFDSTLAYQGFGRELGAPLARSANRMACAGLAPDRTLVLDMNPEAAHVRACAQGADRMEREPDAFHERVRAGFLQIAQDEPARVRVVDASGSTQEVWGRVRAELADLFDLPQSVPASQGILAGGTR